MRRSTIEEKGRVYRIPYEGSSAFKAASMRDISEKICRHHLHEQIVEGPMMGPCDDSELMKDDYG